MSRADILVKLYLVIDNISHLNFVHIKNGFIAMCVRTLV